ncbi:MAG: Uma2 family endonuclease [Chloroflexia bacterium]
MAVAVHSQLLRIVGTDGEIVGDFDTLQGTLTTEQYLLFTNDSRRLIEFTNGKLEVLPMPTKRHQIILGFLYRALHAYMQLIGGIVLFAPLRLQIRDGQFREPDLLLLIDTDDPRGQDAYWIGADMVVEIVSPDNPERDTVVKRADYAEAGIPEYWIVNPEDETVIVLQLTGNQYSEYGLFGRGDLARSVLLEGFSVSTNDIFDAR